MGVVEAKFFMLASGKEGYNDSNRHQYYETEG